MILEMAEPPASIIKALSSRKGRNVAKASAQLLRWAESGQDDALLQRSSRLLRENSRIFKEALPGTDPEIIGGFFASILDLWETGQTLDKQLKKIPKLQFPRDRECLYDILIWISAIQLDMAS